MSHGGRLFAIVSVADPIVVDPDGRRRWQHDGLSTRIIAIRTGYVIMRIEGLNPFRISHRVR